MKCVPSPPTSKHSQAACEYLSSSVLLRNTCITVEMSSLHLSRGVVDFEEGQGSVMRLADAKRLEFLQISGSGCGVDIDTIAVA